MPAKIEKELNTLIKNFIWNSQLPSLSMRTLNSPTSEGGRNVLNIQARNEAIHLMKLKKILDRSPDRPPAADAAEAIIICSLPKHTRDQEAHDPRIIDIFTQQIFNKHRYVSKTLPHEIKAILNTGAKYNLALDDVNLPLNIRLDLPAWYHIGTEEHVKSRENTPAAKCLRNTHNCQRTGNLLILANILDNPQHRRWNKSCSCPPCTNFKMASCKNPETCYQLANHMISNLKPQYNPCTAPIRCPPPSGDERAIIKSHSLNGPSSIKVIKTFPNPKDHASVLRIHNSQITSASFRKRITNPLPLRLTPPKKLSTDTVAYTDGSCTGNGETDAKAGFGVWIAPECPDNASLPVDRIFPQTNNSAEVLAINHAITTTPLRARLHIKTDSRWCVNALTVNLEKAEDQDYISTPQPLAIKNTISSLRMRNGIVSIEWIKGHNGCAGNENANELATLGSAKTPDNGSVTPTSCQGTPA
ncbi:RNase H-domain-containing protein [Cantharellus anzutake]|uniref:RNase H-domain-containing protein n=1 Tax=Cantharellus anzutake TaxID=1750568 RepID=UPI001908D817|nr:RNase H-domain-containing protein [Cantharellus anzutake]KAF8344043.1 RNase H-domain-containing protein [Cantharellus anzutake]